MLFDGVPRLRLAAWRHALANATTLAEVIVVVQRIVCAWPAHSPRIAPGWHPKKISSRDDIEHWARRLASRPRFGSGDLALIVLADLMRTAVERMNELGPRRLARLRMRAEP